MKEGLVGQRAHRAALLMHAHKAKLLGRATRQHGALVIIIMTWCPRFLRESPYITEADTVFDLARDRAAHRTPDPRCPP
ncbi:unnamed protein product, partial [Iphiclides podalirius]